MQTKNVTWPFIQYFAPSLSSMLTLIDSLKAYQLIWTSSIFTGFLSPKFSFETSHLGSKDRRIANGRFKRDAGHQFQPPWIRDWSLTTALKKDCTLPYIPRHFLSRPCWFDDRTMATVVMLEDGMCCFLFLMFHDSFTIPYLLVFLVLLFHIQYPTFHRCLSIYFMGI